MKPGTRVICIDDEFKTEVLHQLQAIPKEGEIYTVRELVPDPLGKLVVGITLEGLVNPKGWMACRGGLVIMEFSFGATDLLVIRHLSTVIQKKMQ